MRERKHFDLFNSFLLALLVHAAIGYCAGSAFLTRNPTVTPVFKAGLSSVELTLVPPLSRPVEPEEDPAVIEDPTDLLPLIEPRQAEPDPVVEEKMDADLNAKGVESEPVSTAEIRPHYPYGSRIRGEEGVVVLGAVLDESGHPREIEVLSTSGYKSLDRAAVRAMSKAVFRFQNGSPVIGEDVEYTFRFRLND